MLGVEDLSALCIILSSLRATIYTYQILFQILKE